MVINLILFLLVLFISVDIHVCNIVRLSEFREKQLLTGNYYNDLVVHGEYDTARQDYANSEAHSQLYGQNAKFEDPKWLKIKEDVKCIADEERKNININKKKKFLINKGPASWFQAWRMCELKGMQFASIQNQEEQDLVELVMKNSPLKPKGAWTGGQNLLSDGPGSKFKKHMWVSNGQYLNYTNWATNEPHGVTCHCVNIGFGNFKWYNGYCSDTSSNYICQYY